MNTIIEINKTQIHKLDLSGEDPLKTDIEKSKRVNLLKNAVQLNAVSSTRVRLVLKDKTRGLFRIKSKINMVSDSNVSLRGGILIPITAVAEVKL